jgi:signal transduction histidine kinase
MKISLQTKMFMFAVVIAALALLGSTGISLQFLKEDKEKSIFEIHRLQVQRIKDEIKSMLLPIDSLSVLLSSLGFERSQALSKDLIRNQEAVLLMASLDISEKKLEILAQSLRLSKEKSQLVSEIEKQWAPSSAFQKRMLSTEGFLWRPEIKSSKIAGNMVLGYARKIADLNGRTQKIILALIDFSSLEPFLKNSPAGDILWVDDQSQVLLGHLSDTTVQKEFLDLVLNNSARSLSTRFSFQSGKYLAGFEKMGLVGTVLSLQSEKQAFAGLKNLTTRLAIIASMALTFSLIFAMIFSRQLTEPLQRLVQRMGAAGAGDYLSPIEVKTQDEIKDLANSFIEMMKEIKASRDLLEESNRNLEAKVLERTLELERQNQVIKETQETLLKTTRLASAGEVAGRAAHEVLNPLTSLIARVDVFEQRHHAQTTDVSQFLGDLISAWKNDFTQGGFPNLVSNWSQASQVIKGKNLFEEDLENLQKVDSVIKESSSQVISDLHFLRHEGQRIVKIVNGMRKLSQPQSDRKECNLHATVKEAQMIMSDLFKKSNLPIQLELKAAADQVLIDREEMLQVLTNLMRNSLQSLQARQRADGYLKLSTANEENFIVILIEDNGIGISQENQSKLFEKQFSTKSSDEGTGLGLSISRRLVRANNGDLVFASSIPLISTLFKLKIPLLKAHKGVAA